MALIAGIPTTSPSMSTCTTEKGGTSLGDAFSRLLSDEDFHDVKLKGSDGVEVSANRYVLAVRSTVFKAMLLGKFSEGSMDAIPIKEYGGDVLRAIVEYIHTDEPQVLNTKKRKATRRDDSNKHHGNSQSLLDAKQILTLVSLAAASIYFDLPGLTAKVNTFLHDMLKESTSMSFTLLEACNQTGPGIPEDLKMLAWSHVRRSSQHVGNLNAVAFLSKETLEEILKDESTNLTEYELFCLLLSWVESNPSDTRRQDAKSLVPLIQLEGISPIHLSSVVEPSDLATPAQLLSAYRAHSMAAKEHILVEKSRVLPVWSNTSSQECTNLQNKNKIGLLQCPPITSSVHQWTLERVGPATADDLGFGIVSNEVPLDFDKWLTEQKGTSVFFSGHSYCDEKILQKCKTWSLAVGEKVTLTLDLRPNKEGNGTLSGRIEKLDGTTAAIGLIRNLLDQLADRPSGFVPAVETEIGNGFRLVDFQKLPY